jgi:hypothetical protein
MFTLLPLVSIITETFNNFSIHLITSPSIVAGTPLFTAFPVGTFPANYKRKKMHIKILLMKERVA